MKRKSVLFFLLLVSLTILTFGCSNVDLPQREVGINLLGEAEDLNPKHTFFVKDENNKTTTVDVYEEPGFLRIYDRNGNLDQTERFAILRALNDEFGYPVTRAKEIYPPPSSRRDNYSVMYIYLDTEESEILKETKDGGDNVVIIGSGIFVESEGEKESEEK